MKRVLFITALIFVCISLKSQTYYNMWRGSGASGQPEWIANSAMTYGFTGIQFTTADRICGYTNANGKWLIIDPQDSNRNSDHINAINTRLNAMSHVGLGTPGYVAANRFIITDLDFTSGVDFFVGYGRSNQMTISNQMTSLLRLNSYGGIAFWGDGLGGDNDSPQFEVKSEEVNTYKTFNLKSGDNTLASLGLGRNNDVTFTSTANKMFRLSIPNGSFGMWLNGNAGIDNAPQFAFNANGAFISSPLTLRFGNDNISYTVKANSSTSGVWMGTTSNQGMEIGTNGITSFYIDENRNVYFGFNKSNAESFIRSQLKTQYRVFVEKGILSEDYAIAPRSAWADYVFSNEYKLMDLSEVESFIEQNNHLPEVPSAKEVSENGYSQHEMNTVLLKKIEELTLYIIKQQKEIEELKNKLQ